MLTKIKKWYYEEYSIISKVPYVIRIKEVITVLNTSDLFH